MAQLEARNDNQDGKLPVTIYSDVICPWCYVGKRRFETALNAPGMPNEVAITWRPFELNPDMPAEGMERSAYRARKFGPDKAAQLDRQMAEVGRDHAVGRSRYVHGGRPR